MQLRILKKCFLEGPSTLTGFHVIYSRVEKGTVKERVFTNNYQSGLELRQTIQETPPSTHPPPHPPESTDTDIVLTLDNDLCRKEISNLS